MYPYVESVPLCTLMSRVYLYVPLSRECTFMSYIEDYSCCCYMKKKGNYENFMFNSKTACIPGVPGVYTMSKHSELLYWYYMNTQVCLQLKALEIYYQYLLC